MKSQEANNNKDSNQKAGCTIFFQNGTSQFIPDVSLKQIMNALKAGGDSNWVAYGNSLLIRVDQIVEVIDNNPEEEDNKDDLSKDN